MLTSSLITARMKTPTKEQKYMHHFSRSFAVSFFSAVAFLLGATNTQAQLFLFNFNAGSGTTAQSTGSNTATGTFINGSGVAANLYGGNQSGCSGVPGNYSFNNMNSIGMGVLTMGNGNGGTFQVPNSAASALNGSKSFTLMGWFYAAITPGGNARLFDYQSAYNNGFLLDCPWGTPGPGILSLSVNGISVNSTEMYSAVNSWVFFAVTYNSLTSTVNFYCGTLLQPAALISSATLNGGAVVAPSSSTYLGIGNTGSGHTRPFDGALDNMAIYSSTTDGSGALTLSQITPIQSAQGSGQ
jgi:hypothetical protein